MSVIKQLIENNTSVQASAGSGKTYLLTSRIVRLLLLGTAPGRILAITFTRKAANEMQTRLLARLLKLSTCSDDELDQQLSDYQLDVDDQLRKTARQLYEQILRSPYPVKTTTFHAFCQELLRRFPLEADVPPGFDLLDTTGILLDEAWEALMVEASTDQAQLTNAIRQLFEALGLHSTRQALVRFIEHRSDWWAYTHGCADAAGYAAEKLATDLQVTAGEDPYSTFFENTYIQQQLREFVSLVALHPININTSCVNNIQQALDNPQLDAIQRLELIRECFLTQRNEPRKRDVSKTVTGKMGASGAERHVELHYQLSERIIELLDQLARLQCLELTSHWYRAGQHYLHHYQRIKLEQRQLDFTDLEWKTWLLLTQGNNASWVQYKLDERMDHFLFDEFQDTNPTQWRLLLPLLQELADGNNDRQRSVFLVGDIKQSIYRFRRAEPRLFEAATEWMQQQLGASVQPLSRSWRSSPVIIQFVNRLFSDGELHKRIQHFTEHDTHLQDLAGSVRLLPLVKEPEQEAEENETPVNDSLRNPLLEAREVTTSQRFYLEGCAIARVIRQLVGTESVSDHNGQSRLVDYDDIMLLIRQRTHAADYEKALREHGIPYIGADRGTLLESTEVNDLLTLLQWLITPFDNLALARILRSPLFAITDQEMIRLYQQGDGNWLDRLQQAASQSEPTDILSIAYQQLTAWRAIADHIPVHDLLDRIYSDGNVLARYSAATPQSKLQRTLSNLNRFLELALEMDSGRYPSLTRFADWLNTLRQQDQDAPDEPVSQTHENRVQLLTIHAAKGLEAPIVFIADSNSTPSANNAYSVLVDWPAENDRPDYLQLLFKSSEHDQITRRRVQQQEQHAQREDANLLYVALTRARQHLYLSGTQSSRKASGWYSLISEQYGIDTADMDETVILEQIGEQAIATEKPVQSSAEVVELDTRLNQSFSVTPHSREIAPSQTVVPTRASPSSDSDYQSRGLVIHWIMEHSSDRPDVDQQQLQQKLTIPCTSELFDDCWNECQQIINADEFASLFNPEHYQRALNEVPVYYLQDGQMVHGIIDRIVINQDTITIIDYKSHISANQHNLDELAEHYRLQMDYYAEGAAKIWPQHKIERVLIFTKPSLVYKFN